MTSQPDFDPYCPSGGSWYACGNGTQFVGCCGEYPCTDTGCSAGLLYNASFDTSKYGTFSDQQCSAGLFYTCTNPAFLGCCEENPCTTGCPSSSLAAMFLSNNPSVANQFDPQPPLAGSASASSSSATSTTSITSSSSTSTPASTTTGSAAASSSSAAPTKEHHSTPIGAIAGGAVGGFALLCAVVFIVWRVKYHSTRSSKKHQAESGVHTRPTLDPNNAYNDNGQEKLAATGIAPMHSPYRDSPSTVPPYSPQHSSQNWSPPMHQGHNQHPHIQEVENHSAFRAYSPQTGNYSPYGHPSQFTPPPLHPSNHAHSYSWGSNSAIDSSQSQSGGPQFARVHQGPPQEMAGSGHQDISWAGLGVHHVGNDYVNRPRAELGE